MKTKKLIKDLHFNLKVLCRKIGSDGRTLPDFLIIGAQKSGTTSLYKYLVMHPQILPSLLKEVHFFDLNYKKSIGWYRSFFPKSNTLLNSKKKTITGEASPQYMFHPFALKRIKEDLSSVKIIVLLRNPVNRAYSHYQHQVRVGRESLSFEEAVESENSRLEGELEKMMANSYYNSFKYLMYSYLRRSTYDFQIKNLFSLFDREKILIIQSEKFNSNPQEEHNKILSFLELPKHELDFSQKYNSHKYPPIKKETKKELEEYFKPHNEKLYKLIGQRFDW